MTDTPRQIGNRIAMWRAEILNPDRDPSIEASTETLLDSLVADVRTLTLLEAADAWQTGQWADAPRLPDRVAERIANGQFVTDWLRKRADHA